MRRLSLIGLGVVLLCSIGVSTAFCADGGGAASTRTSAVVAPAAANPGQGTLATDPFALSPAAFTAQDGDQFAAAEGFEGKSASKSRRCHNPGKAEDHNKHCR
jgi:hypothetical protein